MIYREMAIYRLSLITESEKGKDKEMVSMEEPLGGQVLVTINDLLQMSFKIYQV